MTRFKCLTDHIIAYKPVGKLPFLLIKDIEKEIKKRIKGNSRVCPISARLEPMSKGLMIFNNSNSNNSNKQGNETYTFDMLVGVGTDSHDTLGLITKINNKYIQFISDQYITKMFKLESQLKNIFKHRFSGAYFQRPPMFSSCLFKGIPLWKYAMDINKDFDVNEIQHKPIIIGTLEMTSIRHVSVKEIIKDIIKQLQVVKGKLRQKEIISKWKQFSYDYKDKHLFRVSCYCKKHGGYIRGVVRDLSKVLDIPITVMNIYRQQIGTVSICDLFSFKQKSLNK